MSLLPPEFYSGMSFWLETERTGTSEFCCWFCLSLGKSTCSSFYWSVNIGEILSPVAVGDCNICQIYWHPWTRCFLEGKNVFGKWVCMLGVFLPKLAETLWEKTLLSKTGISRLLTSDFSQCWLIFKCYAWFELHFFPSISLLDFWVYLCHLAPFNSSFVVTRGKLVEKVSSISPFSYCSRVAESSLPRYLSSPCFSTAERCRLASEDCSLSFSLFRKKSSKAG